MSRKSDENLPPHDDASEAGALACVLCSNGHAEELFAELTLDDFYDERHRFIHGRIRHLISQGKPLDTVSLDLELSNPSDMARAGGRDYVTRLPNQAPSPEAFPVFLESLRDKSSRRCAIRDGSELAHVARDLTIPSTAIADAAQGMLSAYAARAKSLPPIVDAASFLEQPMTGPAELVNGVVHLGSKLVLGGGSKSFKTWCLLDLALSVAFGRPWLSFGTAPGRVLYLNFEIQPWSWQRRLESVAKAKDIEVVPDRLCLWNLRGRAADFMMLLPKIRERTRRGNFSLIVLDPIYKLYGDTDENKAGDVAKLLNQIEDLAVCTGSAVAFGAHFSKGNQAAKESIDRISGSGVFARDPDSLLVFTRHESDDAFTVEATLRNFPPIEPFVARWRYPLMVQDDTLDPSKLKRPGRKMEHEPNKILKYLEHESLSLKDWKTVSEQDGISRATFFRLKSHLEQSGKVSQDVVSQRWRLVNTGLVSQVSK